MYHQSLPAKRDVVSNHWQQIQQSDFESDACLEMQNHMHKLAGSSGMYGYDDIAGKAREIEEALIKGVVDDTDRQVAGGLIEEFIAMLDSSIINGSKRSNG